MDECDKASEYQERWLQAQFDEHRHALNTATQYPLGLCRNCESEVAEGMNYCDEDCRDDHWIRIQSTRRNGKGE